MQVLDQDVGQDKVLGEVAYPLLKLVAEDSVKLQLPLLPSLDTDRVKDKKDRGSLTVEVILFERLEVPILLLPVVISK